VYNHGSIGGRERPEELGGTESGSVRWGGKKVQKEAPSMPKMRSKKEWGNAQHERKEGKRGKGKRLNTERAKKNT